MALLLANVVAAVAVGAAAATCSYESVAAFCSEAVRESFDAALTEGHWYEQGYHDLAEAGSSCQTMDVHVDPESKVIASNFSVLYKKEPFTIAEFYEPRDTKGVYRKSVNAPYNFPGGHLVGLPTAIVHVEENILGTRYESIVFYSCYSLGVTHLEAIEIFTRNVTVDQATLDRLIDAAMAKGIQIDRAEIQATDQKACAEARAMPFLV